ncbi:MAG TPA: hypothetical protein VF296_02025 [Gallionella sp.]
MKLHGFVRRALLAQDARKQSHTRRQTGFHQDAFFLGLVAPIDLHQVRSKNIAYYAEMQSSVKPDWNER